MPIRHRQAVGEVPVQFARLQIERARLQIPLIDPRDRRHLGVITGGKNLIRGLKIGIAQHRLDDGGAGRAQQSDDPRPRDAGEKRTVRGRREDNAIFRHEDIGGGELGNVAEHVAQQTIVEAAPARFDKRATSGLSHIALADSLTRAQCRSRSGATPSNARARSNTEVQSHAAWVRGPMIGTLPSCQSSSKNVTVLVQATGRRIELR